jgi:hypothetical protein
MGFVLNRCGFDPAEPNSAIDSTYVEIYSRKILAIVK